MISWIDTLTGATVCPSSRSPSITPPRPEWSMPASTSPRRGVEGSDGRRAAGPGFSPVSLSLIPAIVALLPASMIGRFLPAQVSAEDFSGSFLHGAAGKIMVNARDAGAIEWRIHPLSLLRLAAVARHSLGQGGFRHRRHRGTDPPGRVRLTTFAAAARLISLRDLGVGGRLAGRRRLEFR